MPDICKKKHRYAEVLENLPESQGGSLRHKCAGCAYEAGLKDGFNNTRKSDLSNDPRILISQAGSARHKDAQRAYDIGYEDGLSKYKSEK
ncbi:hypothetical protein A6A19_08305 [Actinobacillus delphinicola]|uniref:Uncharacterized protein n=1 Tax=Actinobacillus delphinicola TaxID=51161 RepID=A0A448TV87_9PAST|nr:hypothetical protein [Actinobacillus delphinicola]MDG6897975.1 hypothetical protein [Actinobacillus delphinicola]VEJ09842.1 Uncharacterised protein [Actinobacillus delphinicola]